jgi:two-component system, OmpR family, copper resistance phosphate regulon response regulator CusR
LRILVIEDDKKVAGFIHKGLTEEQYAVDVCYDGADGAFWAQEYPYDVILLDIMLPKKDGIAVCKELRAQGISTPIIMLTARDTITDKITGLDVGADDYMAKPFSFGELLARIRALLRRSQDHATPRLTLADLELDPATRKVTRSGKEITLTGKEYALLEYLLRNKGRIVTETLIVEHVWDMNYEPGTNVLNVYIHHLRNKLDKGFEPKLLHTIRGADYVLKEPPAAENEA